MDPNDDQHGQQVTPPTKLQQSSSQEGSDSDTLSPDAWELVSPDHGQSPPFSRQPSFEGAASPSAPASDAAEGDAILDPVADCPVVASHASQSAEQTPAAELEAAESAVQERGLESMPSTEDHAASLPSIQATAPSSSGSDEGQKLPSAAAGSPSSAFSYSHADLPGSISATSSFEHAGHDDKTSLGDSWDQASSLDRAHSGKARSEPDSEEALSELQDMSSEGPLSSAEEPVNRMQAHATSAPVEQHDADGQREASVSDRENETDEEDTGHSSLLSLDPETAQAAQDVLDSEPELFNDLSDASGPPSPAGSSPGSPSGSDDEDGAPDTKKRLASTSIYSRAFRAILAWFQEGVRWLSASMPARMVQRFLQQAKQAMSLAYARPYAALTALGGSIVVIGLLIHNRSLREQLRTSTGRIERLEKTLAKMAEAGQQWNSSFPVVRHTASLISIPAADRSLSRRMASLSIFI